MTLKAQYSVRSEQNPERQKLSPLEEAKYGLTIEARDTKVKYKEVNLS